MEAGLLERAYSKSQIAWSIRVKSSYLQIKRTCCESSSFKQTAVGGRTFGASEKEDPKSFIN